MPIARSFMLAAAVALAAVEPGAADRMKDLYKAGDFVGALAAARDVLVTSPGDADALAIAGSAALRTGAKTDAEGFLRRAVEADPKRPGLNYQIGMILLDRADTTRRLDTTADARVVYAEAADAFTREFALSPRNPRVLAGRAVALLGAGRTDEAIAAHEAWITAVPEEAAPLVSLATTLAEGGRWDGIVPLLDRATPAREAFLDAVIGMHSILFDRERRADAVELMKRAAARDPELAADLEARVRKLASGTGPNGLTEALAAYLASGASREAVRAVLDVAVPFPTDDNLRDAMMHEQLGVEPPKILTKVEPLYPDIARRAGIEGLVQLFAFVSKNGIVRDAFVYGTTNPMFDDAALTAVRAWKYSPATADGAPVLVPYRVTVTFRLRSRR